MVISSHSKTPPTSTEEHTSSSSSNGSSSTPNTPPSPVVQPRTPPTVAVPPQPSRYTPSPAASRKSPRTTPKSRLGAIDEDSEAVSPDLPVRNPMRRFGLPAKFSILPIPTLHATKRPAKDIYHDVEGPRGEKFSDVRQNKKVAGYRRCSRRSLVCILCLVLIVGAAVAIGVIVGLKVRDNRRSHDQTPSTNPTNPSNPGSGSTAAFPAGQYTITTYLNDVETSCTSYTSTWRCYPYQTYTQSQTGSLSTLSWNIAEQKDGTYTISSADPVFSYPFENVTMTRKLNGTDSEYWTFSTLYDKVVLPTTSLTGDGTATKCFFNGTQLLGRLYTKMGKAQALQNATTSTGGASGTTQSWPYALDFSELHGNGANVPDCYEYVNGQLGQNLGLNSTASTTAGLSYTCGCTYQNYFNSMSS